MTGPEQPRSATAALRNLLERFHPVQAGGAVEYRAVLDRADLTARLNDLAALERAEIAAAEWDAAHASAVEQLTAVRTELARAREQRDRALNLTDTATGAAVDQLRDGRPIATRAVVTEWRADLDRLRRMRDGLDERQPSTLYDAIHAALLNLADQLPGEPAPVLLAWGVEPLTERLTDAVEASGVMNGPTA